MSENPRVTVLPPDHPQRRDLNNEVHARPPDAMVPPLHAGYLVLLSTPERRAAERAELEDLLERLDGPLPPPGANHFSAELGPFRVTFEQHTEFVRYTFIVQGAPERPFVDTAFDRVPAEWLSSLRGALMAATHVVLLPAPQGGVDVEALARQHFSGNELVGAVVEGGFETALTDFRIHGDRCSRLIVFDHDGGAEQTGRSVQRLLELETYRIMALMALPVARGLVPHLEACERSLAEISDALVTATAEDEAGLLDRLSRLQADLGRHDSATHSRFAAAAAYHALVQRRVRDLREERIPGLQTFQEFTERRLSPAIATCSAVARRLESLLDRTARMIQTLATRVEMTREQQSQELLASMNRRVRLQLRLQGTVEGLSVAAITYYLVGLVSYLAKGLEAAEVPVDDALLVGLSVPLVAFLVYQAVRRIREEVGHDA